MCIVFALPTAAAIWACVGDDPGSPTGSAQDSGALPGDDGSIDAPPPLTRFCETLTPKPALCDDFERTDAIGAPWLAVIELGGSIAFGEEPGNRFARSTFGTLPEAGSRSVNLVAGSQKSVSKASISLKLRFSYSDGPLDGGDALVLSVLRRFKVPRGAAYVGPAFSALGEALVAQAVDPDGGSVTVNLAAPLPVSLGPNQWHSVRIEMNLKDKVARLLVSGLEQANVALPSDFDQGPVEAIVGVTGWSSPHALVVDSDDVSFDYAE